MTIHVNDFLCTGDTDFIESLILKLRNNFIVVKMKTKCFKYLGLKMKHEETNITLGQKNYVDNIK